MGIAEPDSPLWRAVKAVHDSWPPDDEAVAHGLADTWRSGGELMATEVGVTGAAGARLPAVWGDDTGAALHGRIERFVQDAGLVHGRIQGHAAHSGHYAAELVATKTAIVTTIAANETTFALLANPLLGVTGTAMRTAFAAAIAAHLQGVVTAKAAALRAYPTGRPAVPPPSEPAPYGVDDVAADVVRWWGGVDQSTWALVGDRAEDVYEGLGDLVGGGLNLLGGLTGIEELSRTGDEWRARLDSEGKDTGEEFLGLGADDNADINRLATWIDGDKEPVTIYVDRVRYPESAAHVDAAQTGTSYRGAESTAYARTQPRKLTIDRAGAKDNRRESLKGIPSGGPGHDRDEYPPAMFEEGGEDASVKHIDRSDNRGAGASMGHQARYATVEDSEVRQTRKLEDGETVIIETRR